MRKGIIFAGTMACLAITATTVYSQSISPHVLNTSGGSAFINNIKFDWSIGEAPLVGTMQSTIIVTNGFLQPVTDQSGDVNNNSSFSPTEIRVFPNPASTYIEVNVLSAQSGMLHLRLYNSMGQMVFHKQVTYNGIGLIERIDMMQLPSTEYLLHLALDPAPGSVMKKGSYKIIKIN